MKGIETLQRQQFHLEVSAQEICAYDNVQGVVVKHFAVLSHFFIAQTYGHIDSPQGVDGSSILNPYGHSFGFQDLGLLQQSAGHD